MDSIKPLERRIDGTNRCSTFDPKEMAKFIQGKPDDERFIVQDENGDIFWIATVGLVRQFLSELEFESTPAPA